MRRFSLLVASLFVLAVLVPAQAQAFKPEIVDVRATDDDEGIRFTVKVRMDKGGRNQRDVNVTYDGNTRNAAFLKRWAPLSFYETGPFAAPVRDCYRVEIRAKNRHGVTTRTMRAPLVGGNGC